MYVQSIKYQTTERGEWRRGYYIGDTDNSKNSTFLDENYQPLPKNEEGFQVWDYHTDVDNWIQFRCNEPNK